MIDSVLYPDEDGMCLKIDVTSSGQASAVLYRSINGMHETINVVSTGQADAILYNLQMVEYVTLTGGGGSGEVSFTF